LADGRFKEIVYIVQTGDACVTIYNLYVAVDIEEDIVGLLSTCVGLSIVNFQDPCVVSRGVGARFWIRWIII